MSHPHGAIPDPRLVLTQMEIPDYPGIFILGSYERNVSILAQQIRSINLALSLEAEKRLPSNRLAQSKTSSDQPDCDVIIIGNGIAGKTAAAMLRRAHCKVRVVGSKAQAARNPAHNSNRFIHPLISDFPFIDSNLADLANANLPVLNWSADRAEFIYASLHKEWDKILAENYSPDPKLSEIDGLVQNIFTCQDQYYQVAISNGEILKAPLIIIAAGLGELSADTNYWSDAHVKLLEDAGKNQKWILAGMGDSNIAEFTTLVLKKNRSGSAYQGLIESFARIDDRELYQKLLVACQDLEQKCQYMRDGQASKTLEEGYKDIINEHKVALKLASDYIIENIKKSRPAITINTRNVSPYNREAFPLNRLALALMLNVQKLNTDSDQHTCINYVQGTSSIVLDSNLITSTNQRSSHPDSGCIVQIQRNERDKELHSCHHFNLPQRPESPLKAINLDGKTIDERAREDLKPRNALDQTRHRMWPFYGNLKRILDFATSPTSPPNIEPDSQSSKCISPREQYLNFSNGTSDVKIRMCYIPKLLPISSVLLVGDLINVHSLAAMLMRPVRIFDSWLAGRLSPKTRDALKVYQDPSSDLALLQQSLRNDLNQLIAGASIYQKGRFNGIELRPETKDRVSQSHQSKDIHFLNRLLMEDAYPREVLKIPTGIGEFWVSKYPITNDEYEKITTGGNHTSRRQGDGRGKYPKVNVSWNEALEFCKRIGVSLPTDLQWQACWQPSELLEQSRKRRQYPWGDDDNTIERDHLVMKEAGSDSLEDFKYSTILSVDDLMDFPSLFEKLKRRVRVLDDWLAKGLSKETKDALKSYPGPGANPSLLQRTLLYDLNKIIFETSIYDQQRFKGIDLRPKTMMLISHMSKRGDYQYLNRMLMEDAYPREVRKIQKKTPFALSNICDIHRDGNFVPRDGCSVCSVDSFPDSDGPWGTSQQFGNILEWCLSGDTDFHRYFHNQPEDRSTKLNAGSRSRLRPLGGVSSLDTEPDAALERWPQFVWAHDETKRPDVGFRIVWIPNSSLASRHAEGATGSEVADGNNNQFVSNYSRKIKERIQQLDGLQVDTQCSFQTLRNNLMGREKWSIVVYLGTSNNSASQGRKPEGALAYDAIGLDKLCRILPSQHNISFKTASEFQIIAEKDLDLIQDRSVHILVGSGRVNPATATTIRLLETSGFRSKITFLRPEGNALFDGKKVCYKGEYGLLAIHRRNQNGGILIIAAGVGRQGTAAANSALAGLLKDPIDSQWSRRANRSSLLVSRNSEPEGVLQHEYDLLFNV